MLGLTGNFNRAMTGGGTQAITLAAAGEVRWNGSGGFAAYGGTRTVTLAVSSADASARTVSFGGVSTTATNSNAVGFVPSLSSLILDAHDADGTVDLTNNISFGNGNNQGWQVQRVIDVRNGPAAIEGRLSGVLSSEYGMDKIGAGTLELTNANTYQGGTIINGGTLLVNNLSGSGTGAGFVNVNSGGTLGGAGTITGAFTTVTVNSGGSIAPGNSVGTLTLAKLTLQSGSGLSMELEAPGTSDLINVTSTNGLTLNGGSVSLSDAGGLAAGTYTLVDYAGVFGGSLANLGTPTGPAGFTYALQDNLGSTTIELVVTAIGGESVWSKDDSVSNWSDNASWTGGVPNAAGASATFGSVITANQQVNVDVPVTVGTMNFNNANAYTLAGSAITMDATSGSYSFSSNPSTWVATQNISIDDDVLVTEDTTINSLRQVFLPSSSVSVDIASNKRLTIPAGILSAGSSYNFITGGEITSGPGTNSELIVTVPDPAGTLEIASWIVDSTADDISFVKTGKGTVRLSGNNSYSGGTVVNQGTLEVASSASIGNSSTLKLLGSHLRSVSGGGILIPQVDVTTSGHSFIDTNGSDVTLGSVTGTGTLTKECAGTLAVLECRCEHLRVAQGVTKSQVGLSNVDNTNDLRTLTVDAGAQFDLTNHIMILREMPVGTAAPDGTGGYTYDGVLGMVQRGRGETTTSFSIRTSRSRRTARRS